MSIGQEQYRRFLNNECSEEERTRLINYLKANPEVLEKWLQQEHWEQFKEDVHLHPAFSDNMRIRFMEAIQRRRRQRRNGYRWTAVAAIAGLIGCLVWLLQEHTVPQPVATLQKKDTLVIAWEDIHNNSNSTQKIIPADGSVIQLMAHSHLRYKKHLDSNKREFYLQGVAQFDVAKDKHRPFTVYAGGTATTALGTSFKVMARKQDKEVKVRLFEGKVVVQASAASVYLMPGDELSVNAGGGYHRKVMDGWNQPAVKKNAPEAVSNALVFTNKPMPEVLEALQQQFGATIKYDAKEIGAINVTATFTKQDSLSGMLTILCTLNDLLLQGSGATFAITR